MLAAAAAETLLAMPLLLRLLYSQCALLSAGHSVVSVLRVVACRYVFVCVGFVRLVCYYYVRVVSTIVMFILWNNDEIINMNRT